MNMTTREQMVQVLGAMAQRVCAYGGRERCDCKYARHLRNLGRGIEDGCGCCELRSAAEVLRVMTKREWDELTRRVNFDQAVSAEVRAQVQGPRRRQEPKHE